MAAKKTSGDGTPPELLAAAVLGACNIVAAQIAHGDIALTNPGEVAEKVFNLVSPLLDMASYQK